MSSAPGSKNAPGTPGAGVGVAPRLKSGSPESSPSVGGGETIGGRGVGEGIACGGWSKLGVCVGNGVKVAGPAGGGVSVGSRIAGVPA